MRLFPHAVLAIVVVYAFIGGYITINTVQNHFPGVTWIQNINGLGNVIQYHMQDETTAPFVSVSHMLDRDIAAGVSDPYFIMDREPSLIHHNAALSGMFAQAVILHHPAGFLWRTLPLFISYPLGYYQESAIALHHHFPRPLSFLLKVH